MMHRRRLVSGLTAVAAASLASGQTPARVHRIGYLGYTAINSKDEERYLAAFSQRLRELGLVVGDNLVVEWRFAEGRNDRYAEFAAEMVWLGAELVVAASGVAARAVMAASRSMPIVTVAVPDPVRAGLVVSLARSGGQLTGISNLADELVPKRLELLKAGVPKASRIALARCPRWVRVSAQPNWLRCSTNRRPRRASPVPRYCRSTSMRLQSLKPRGPRCCASGPTRC